MTGCLRLFDTFLRCVNTCNNVYYMYKTELPLFWPPTDGISTPLPMVFWPPIHGISTPLPMVYWPPYPWYIDPPIHGILTPLPIEYQPPYTWYFDLTAYLLIRNGGGGSKYHGGSIYYTGGVQYTMDVNWPRVQNTIRHREPVKRM